MGRAESERHPEDDRRLAAKTRLSRSSRVTRALLFEALAHVLKSTMVRFAKPDVDV